MNGGVFEGRLKRSERLRESDRWGKQGLGFDEAGGFRIFFKVVWSCCKLTSAVFFRAR
jgi:hypothetical protein